MYIQSSANNGRPIGVFDSGVGGLSVFKAIRQQLPDEQLIYVADSAHAPYGDQKRDYILERSHTVVDYLQRQSAKAVVVACNTASVVAIDSLRANSDIPLIGIEPAIKPAVAATRTGVVGVLATRATIASAGVARLCEQYCDGVRVVLQACPGLVELIENGQTDTVQTQQLLMRFLQPLKDANADTVVLGCTHYPFVVEIVQRIMGDDVVIIEPGAAVARQLKRRLGESVATLSQVETGVCHAAASHDTFLTTGCISAGAQVMSSLLGKPVKVSTIHAGEACN